MFQHPSAVAYRKCALVECWAEPKLSEAMCEVGSCPIQSSGREIRSIVMLDDHGSMAGVPRAKLKSLEGRCRGC